MASSWSRRAGRARRGRLALCSRPTSPCAAGRRAGDGAGRRHDDQRHDEAARCRPITTDDDAEAVTDGRQQRRDDHRRRQHEPDPERRRQPVARRVRATSRRRVAGRHLTDVCAPQRQTAVDKIDSFCRERRAGRPDHAQQAVFFGIPPRQMHRPIANTYYTPETCRSRSASAPLAARRELRQVSPTKMNKLIRLTWQASSTKVRRLHGYARCLRGHAVGC